MVEENGHQQLHITKSYKNLLHVPGTGANHSNTRFVINNNTEDLYSPIVQPTPKERALYRSSNVNGSRRAYNYLKRQVFSRDLSECLHLVENFHVLDCDRGKSPNFVEDRTICGRFF